MATLKYTNDIGTQIVLSLLKAHGIKRVIASPGTTNIALVASMQIDPWFEMYSAVDERGAAYMAVGMAAASGEPVVITCTEATASRNYYSAMTEAYYRKLPILAITGTHGRHKIGHLEPQVIDRTVIAKDACRFSTEVGKVRDSDDERNVIVNVNNAILELTRHGGGPVHINLQASIQAGFTTDVLPEFRKINRISYFDIEDAPKLPNDCNIAIFVGCHKPFTNAETHAIEEFCRSHNAVVLCDITSGYDGEFKITPQLLFAQHNQEPGIPDLDLLIHIGEISADYYSQRFLKPKDVWRVSEDGEIRDLFGKLTNVFEMREIDFFKHFTNKTAESTTNQIYGILKELNNSLFERIPELPFSNFWLSQELYKHLNKNVVVHTSILNSNRASNLANNGDIHNEFRCNVGGFGIDGAISTIIGSALIKKDLLHLLIIGDLAFFYDMNALGNRHLPSNIRILLINNSVGTEFKNYDHPGSMWGNDADKYIAASNHFGNKSKTLVKNYAENLGLDYLSAENKKEFLDQIAQFLSLGNKSIVFEVFTDSKDESSALLKLRTISTSPTSLSDKLKSKVKRILGK